MPDLFSILSEDPFFAKIDDIASQKSLLFEGLWDAPKSLIIRTLFEKSKGHLIIVTEGDRKEKLFEDLLYFEKDQIFDFPAWEVLIGEEIKPSPDIMGERLNVLRHLSKSKKPAILITSLASILQKVVSQEAILISFDEIHVGEEIGFEFLSLRLEELGYQKTKLISDKGQFAIRGGIIDVYPSSSSTPYRIEFIGDTVEEIRAFDPMSQKSHAQVKEFTLGHADEYQLTRSSKKVVSLLDYLPGATLIFDNLLAIEDRLTGLKQMMQVASPYFIEFHDLLTANQQKIFFADDFVENYSEQVKKQGNRVSFEIFGAIIESVRVASPFLPLDTFYENDEIAEGISGRSNEKIKTFFLTQSDKESEDIRKKIPHLPEGATFLSGYLSSGFALPMSNIAVIPYTEFTHRYKVRRKNWRTSYHTPVSEFHAIEPGDLVVHFHNGIGKFLGMEKQKNHLGQLTEFLIIEYSEGSKLFVPAAQSHLVSRYIGSKEEIPDLHKLGQNQWQRQKLKAQQSIIGYAKDLIELQAKKEIEGGFVYPEDSEEMRLFEEAFEYVETDDQLRAINDIKGDMISQKPLDRLVCGDVGYGKTEVAMRAAFKTVVDGKRQVAVLVPTTVLAMQHYESFCDRMALFDVKMGIASRFQTAKEVQKTIEKAALGEIDILIGTHRLLSDDVLFNDLGLIIIDEEQRFGVRAKEKLKKLKVNADCLTLTATPIPRTLYFSLIGARAMSVISSPPHDRLPIRTIISEREGDMMKNALLRELSRGGQVYFVHNRVESIHKVADELQSLVPSALIGVVHGQMSADTIDDVFHAFKSGKINVLVATTIIENGIDVPNANTILIDRADCFGISDLYQMRGRVGRWNKSAYAYFIVPENKTLPEPAKKRLQALVEASGFGGGMKLAMRDLEIRGAGDILGVQQSGHIGAIGFHLYCKLLKKAIDAMKKKQKTSFVETKFEFTFDAKLSESYISDATLRLETYHRLGDAASTAEVDDIFTELKDRFGTPPLCAIWLYHISRIRIFCSDHNFLSVKFLSTSAKVERQEETKVEEKSILMPTFDDPALFEKFFLHRLCEQFKISLVTKS